MSCYNPMFVQRKIDKITGFVETKFIGRLDNTEEREVLFHNFSGNKDIDGYSYSNSKIDLRLIQIPCGKCIGCRIDYSRSWADRMTYHSFTTDNNYFVTLTYSDEALSDLSFSEDYGIESLNYEHMTDFIKRLRNKFRDCDIDYFYSGEYGDSSFRPHFHAIIYNLPLTDLIFYKLNNNGDPIYTSDTLSLAWQDKGFVTVSPFSWRGAAYTASYVEKKRDGRKLCEYTAVGIEPEKARMSRRPGIAHGYYLEHFEDLWKNDGLSVDRTINKTGKLGIPRYFRKLAQDKNIGLHEFLDYQKRSNDLSNVLNPLKVDNSSFDLADVRKMLEFEERDFLKKSSQKLL